MRVQNKNNKIKHDTKLFAVPTNNDTLNKFSFLLKTLTLHKTLLAN